MKRFCSATEKMIYRCCYALFFFISQTFLQKTVFLFGGKYRNLYIYIS